MAMEDVFSEESVDKDGMRGTYLCEVCEDVMTDHVLPAAESPTGRDLAICRPCLALVRSGA